MKDNRHLIEKVVRDDPGITYRELADKTGLANGTIQYYVRKSDKIKKKGGLVHDRTCQECSLRDKCDDKCLLRKLRNPVTYRVRELLLDGKKNKEISDELEIDASTVTYHKKKLERNKLLDG